MPYIDYKYYSEQYVGEPLDEEAFPRYLRRAEEVIDSITRYAVKRKGLAAFDEFVQEQVKTATAAQIEYYAINGLEVATDGKLPESFTVGKVSVTNGGGSAGNGGRSNAVAPKVRAALEQTGLLNRGVGVC